MIAGLKPYPKMKDSGVQWLGEVPEHWNAAAVKRHYAIQLGKMLQGRLSGPRDVEVPYLKAQHIQWFAVRTANAPIMWASPRDLEQFGVSVGDLLVGRRRRSFRDRTRDHRWLRHPKCTPSRKTVGPVPK
jgi:type I restriction enzyme S subunit